MHTTACLTLLLLSPRLAAGAEPRTALVIGNGRYASAPLANPGNDARDVAQALHDVGFEVRLHVDLDQKGMKRTIRDFGDALRERSGVGLFYYSGHGMQVGGENYLIPIGANIGRESDVDIEAVRVAEVLAGMEGAGTRVNLLFLDACRDNPVARSFRSASRGLAFMNAPSGTLIAYSTAPGSTAADGEGRNGVYTGALLQFLHRPGVSVEDMLKDVRIEVKRRTGDRQVPWESSSLTGHFAFLLGSDASTSPPPTISCPAGTELRAGACVATSVACPTGSRWDGARCVAEEALVAVAAVPPARARLGNPDRGRAVYMANCESCHGPAGKGDGVVAAALEPRPRDFRAGRFKFDTDKDGQPGTQTDLTAVVEKGAAAYGGSALMAPWVGRLSKADLADVVVYVQLLSQAR